MTIANTKASSSFNGNGVTRAFELGFVYDENVSGLSIKVVDSEGAETEVTSNYTIYNGILTYPTIESGLSPLDNGYTLTVERMTPLTQEINLEQQGPLDAEVLEGGYDKLTLISQETKESLVGKQDAIEDLDDIRSNAESGKNAADTISTYGNIVTHDADEFVSASELATVATSGDYQDLNNKPSIPIVNNATITFTQGGTTKGSFTLNQSSNQTIALETGGGGGGGGAVDSVNGKTGTVVLTASDVGAASASSLSAYRTSAAQDVIDEGKVTKSGTETITGQKTFTKPLQLSLSLTDPVDIIDVTDTDLHGNMTLSSDYASSGMFTYLTSHNYASNYDATLLLFNNDMGAFSLSLTGSGNAENLSLSGADTSTSSTVIPTKGWVNQYKADTDLSNLTAEGQSKFDEKADIVNAYMRQYTPLNIIVATGNTGIAGTYTLSNLPDDNKIRIAFFEVSIQLSSAVADYSAMSLFTDVLTTGTTVVGTNNGFEMTTTICMPVKRQITIGFPHISGGVDNSLVRLLGYY